MSDAKTRPTLEWIEFRERARLIAVAPDLLKALRVCADVLRDAGCPATEAHARALIARIEGGDGT